VIIREIPWNSGRFFEIQDCNVILEDRKDFTYLVITCHCHTTPIKHLDNIATIFLANKSYYYCSPFSEKWLHVIEYNPSGRQFFKSLTQNSENSCGSLRICSTMSGFRQGAEEDQNDNHCMR